MDLGRPLIEYDRIGIRNLRDAVAALDEAFWTLDEPTRKNLAGERPGRAVYFYNDEPHFLPNLPWSKSLNPGAINILRNLDYPLFGAIHSLVEDHVLPHYPACDIMRVQLAELPPRSKIGRHRDDRKLAIVHRLHIPIITNPGVRFLIDDQSFILSEGLLYELNNVVAHSVENDSDDVRVHLLIDMLPNAIARAVYHDSRADMARAAIAGFAHADRASLNG